MEGPEITFLFQFGSMRDAVSICAPALTLKTLKDMACDFINSKVNVAPAIVFFDAKLHEQIIKSIDWSSFLEPRQKSSIIKLN